MLFSEGQRLRYSPSKLESMMRLASLYMSMEMIAVPKTSSSGEYTQKLQSKL